MTENGAPGWIETIAKAVVTSVPFVGGPLEVIISDIRARRAAKAAEFLERISRSQNERDFLERLKTDARLECIFVEAVETAIKTSLDSKRRVLANAVSDASLNPDRIDASELIVDTLSELDVRHVRALSLLSDEWDTLTLSPTHLPGAGTSAIWQELPAPTRAALVRTGTGKATPSTIVISSDPRRSDGITDFGLELVVLLRAEGWRP
ncbi:hypothetical protein [Cryobacterium sp. PH31-L1]|uniref:hypothetical protein n=1 Tax=Cryobacterium sp. PH31-L1 TaxID=3046199 RepID=UPI0024BB0CBF|nr:hypothetical protein [Cryobacterium sp. PH31-L1]MDJ0378507.1 hypothetical protein [Cryobacterium sp. PH31-L1]